jgi:hypothetical protein
MLVLVCFLAVLPGVSAFAGHACCGNCTGSISHKPVVVPIVMAADNCCPVNNPVETACACTFQSVNDQDQPSYSLAPVSTTGDDLSKGWTVATSSKDAKLTNRQSRVWTTRVGTQARSGPIYLTNQSFLC